MALIGLAVLGISIVLFLFRRIVQDKEPVHLREATPALPGEEPAPPAVGVPAT